MDELFSDRHGYQAPDAQITVWEDAPIGLRHVILAIAKNQGMTPTEIREIVCRILSKVADPYNWSDYPNVWNEVICLVEQCDWFKVYDIAEELYRVCQEGGFGKAEQYGEEKFSDALNQFFRANGIGWQMDNGKIIFRGSEVFDTVTRKAASALAESKIFGAAEHVQEALFAISRRPDPDTTGAIYHAMVALESTARHITGQSKLTLGSLVPKLNLPKPLDNAVEKLWGYSSEYARHIREDRKVNTAEAELVVTVAAALCTFLAKQNPTQ